MSTTPQPYIELSDEHEYFVDGELKPSVTQILKHAGLVDTTWFTEFGRWRGSAVHKATMYFDQGDIDRRTLDPIVKPFVSDWADFRKKTGFTPTMIEEKRYDHIYDYCGTFDRVGYFAGEKPEDANVLIDLKTYPSGTIPFWVRYQLSGYGRLLDPKRIWRRIACVLTGNGANVIEYAQQDYMSDINKFLACTVVARIKQENYIL